MMTEIYLKKRLQKETIANYLQERGFWKITVNVCKQTTDQDSKNGYERSGMRQRGSTEKEGKQISK